MKTGPNAIVFVTLTALSTFGVANTAQAQVNFRMNQGVAYGENGDMGITTQVEDTMTVDFNDLIPNVEGSKSSENFSNDFATYTFENGNSSSVIADQWVPQNIDGTINKDNPYLTVFSGDKVTIDLNENANYFGLNWGSVSQNNRIEFYRDGQLINAFQSAGTDTSEIVEGQADLNAAWQIVKGDHTAINFWNEADAYLEFWAEDAASVFDQIILSQVASQGTAFETDNHSFLLSDNGFNPKGVPEPGMVVGLLAVGGMIAKKAAKKA